MRLPLSQALEQQSSIEDNVMAKVQGFVGQPSPLHMLRFGLSLSNRIYP